VQELDPVLNLKKNNLHAYLVADKAPADKARKPA
jgi:hypothetical protein